MNDLYATTADAEAAAIDAELAKLEAADDITEGMVELAIAAHVDAKRIAADIAAPWEERVARARAWLARACQGGARWKTAAGSAYVAADSERASWDDKALTALCNDDPELAARIWQYRKVTAVRGGLTIKGA